jgi:YVTN family beta-propeller protein
MTNSYSPSIRFFRNTLVLATAFATLVVMTLPGLASATTPSTTAVTSITVGANPYGVAVSPDGSSVWVANYGGGTGNTVSRINTATNLVTDTITVGTGPVGVAVSPDGSSVWVTNYGDGTVSQINTANNTVVATTTVGVGPQGVAVSPDGSSVWVTNYGDGTVSRIIFPPQAPSNVSATPGDAKATISWSAPTNTGGSPITGYSATASPGGKSCTTTTATSCTISGLTNGTTYSVSVTASNAVGTSDPSVVAVTPAVPVVTAAIAKLAATGSDLFSPSWLIVALFGLGGGALLVSRRRKTQPQS